MNQILGINLQNYNLEESLTGCHSLETLSDDSPIILGVETNDSTGSAKIDWLSQDRQLNPILLSNSQPDSADLSAIGQEADNSPEINRFLTDLLPEPEDSQTSLNPF